MLSAGEMQICPSGRLMERPSTASTSSATEAQGTKKWAITRCDYWTDSNGCVYNGGVIFLKYPKQQQLYRSTIAPHC